MNKNQIYQQISGLQKQIDSLKKEVQNMPNYGDCAIMRGAWVRDKGRKACFRLGHIEKDGRIYDIAGVLRPATLGQLEIMTHKEIESHLINEAKLRGLIGWGKFKWPHELEVSIINAGWGYEYRPLVDALVVDVAGSFKRAIYHDGEWAQAIAYNERTEEEMIREFKDYLSKAADGLREKCNIHKWHVIDIPSDMLGRGLAIPSHFEMESGMDVLIAMGVFSGKFAINFEGFNFIVR